MRTNSKETQTIPLSQVLEVIPGDLLLARSFGPAIYKRGNFEDKDGFQWPSVLLFSGDPKQCILYGNCLGNPIPDYTSGLLELLLAPVLTGSDASVFRQCIESSEVLPTEGLTLIQRILPGRLCLILLRHEAKGDALAGIQELFPSLILASVEGKGLFLTLPMGFGDSAEALEALFGLLTDEVPADPLILCGLAIEQPDQIHVYGKLLAELGKPLYEKGVRGIVRQETLIFESLCLENSYTFESEIIKITEPLYGDPELSGTALRFIECSLSINDTAQALYLHRNTLVYRLAKIQRLTGLDIRSFRDAMTVLMVDVLRKNRGL